LRRLFGILQSLYLYIEIVTKNL